MKTSSIAALLIVLSLCATGQSKSSAGPKPSPVAANWIAAWNSHDAGKVVALFTPDVMYEDVAFAQVNHGTEELRKFAQSEFDASPDLHVELVSSSIQGNRGTIEWVFSGTDKDIFKTGKKYSVRGVSVLELKNGKIVKNQDFYDVATVMRQLGLLPASQ